MKMNLHRGTRFGMILIGIMLFTVISNATVYTATSSGNWSNAATWGGTAPGNELTQDQIIIPAGITVTMTNNVHMNAVPVSLTVNGTLNATKNSFIVSWGNIAGSGTIDLDDVEMNGGATITFSGIFKTKTMTSSMTNFAVGTALNVIDTLTLTGGTMTLQVGGSLSLGNNATLIMKGGTMINGGGLLNLNTAYNVQYKEVSATTGLELSGTGLKTILLNLLQGNKLSLASNMIMKADLSLMSGILKLNGYDLTIQGDVTSVTGGFFESDTNSDLTLNSPNSMTGVMEFNGSSNAVGKLTVNTPSQVNLKGTLSVKDNLILTNGNLNISNTKLWLNGDMTGTGTLSGNNQSELAINAAAGLSSPLKFKTGEENLKNLFIRSAAAVNVALASSLTVHDSLLILNASNLDIGAHTLTMGTEGNISGLGSLLVNANSGLVINSTEGMTNPVPISGTTIGSITVNTGTGKSILLKNNLSVATMLNLQNGTMILNGKNLTITGNIAAGGNGYVASNSSSDIVISAAANTSGALKFDGMNNSVNNLKINMSTYKTAIEGQLAVDGILELNSGTLSIDKATLILNNKMTGNGLLSGGPNANLVINAASVFNAPFKMAAGGQKLKDFTINTAGSIPIIMGNSLNIEGALNLVNSNQLTLGNNILTFGTNGTIEGSGQMNVDSSSTIVINAANGINTPMNIKGNSLGNLTINTHQGQSVLITNDLVISKKLNLLSGALDLNENNLTITGDIETGGQGTITSTNNSNITVASKTAPSGALAFSPWGFTVNTLTIDIASGATVYLDSDLDITQTMEFKKGKLDVRNYELKIDSTAIIYGANAASYIIADTAGYLSMQVNSGTNKQVLFPVGTTAFYAPAQLSLSGISKSGRIKVNVLPNVWEESTSGKDLSLTQPLVDATWNMVADSSIQNMNMTSELMWPVIAEVNNFNHNNAYVSSYNGTNWDKTNSGAATQQSNGMYSMKRQNMSNTTPLAVFGQNAVTEVNNIVVNGKYSAYPNPATSTIYVYNSELNFGINTVEIFNLSGQVVKSINMIDSKQGIGLEELNPGSYFIRISGKDTNEIIQFIKQ